MSLEEKAKATAGSGAWTAGPLVLSDGPNGVRGPTFDERETACCTPCGTALAATWDPALVHAVGALVGAEAVAKGVHVVLGPVLNIPRSPLGGRTFEGMGEDPLLAGRLGAAWIEGVQSAGVAACPKHFVCNDSETARTRVDVAVSERALREIYLAPFEQATAAWTLMAAYNAVAGVPCTEHVDLLRRVLKGEWGWDGVVLSDWYAARRTVAAALGGLDLEMPGPPRAFGPALADAVAAGTVPESVLDEQVERIARLRRRVDHRAPPPPVEPGVLRAAAAAGMVLLRNDGVLPLRGAPRLAVIGPAATDPCLQGGGSAAVGLGPVVSPLAALRERFDVVYERGCSQREGAGPLHALVEGGALTVEYLAGDTVVERESRAGSRLVWLRSVPAGASRVRVRGRLVAAAGGEHRLSVRGSAQVRLRAGGRDVARFDPPRDMSPLHALFSDTAASGAVTLAATEAVEVEAEMALTDREDHVLVLGGQPPEAEDGIERAAAAAAQADAAIVMVGTHDGVEAEGRDRTTVALPGRQDELVRRVIAANPATIVVVNAGAAVAMPWADEAAAVLLAWFGGQALGPALADVLAGEREPGGRLPISLPDERAVPLATAPGADGRLRYDEDVFVGYRDGAAGVRFPFGHGLGYATFAFEALSIGDGEVTVTVRNDGDRSGKEVVQLYVSPPAGAARPPLELRGFATLELEAGERRTVALPLGERAFATWDGGWVVPPGEYGIHVGRSVRDLRLHDRIAVG